MTAARVLLAGALASLLLAGCGGEQAGGGARKATRSDRLVDFSKKPPFVNALDIDPASNEFLLTTNRGFWRIDSEDGHGQAGDRGASAPAARRRRWARSSNCSPPARGG